MGVVTGASVLIKFDNGTIVGQRDVKLGGGETDMIDVSDVHAFPDRVFAAGWKSPQVLELPNCVLISGTGGFATWTNLAEAGELGDIEITLGASGDVGTGQAFVLAPTFDTSWEKDGTMSLKFQISGGLTWAEGA
jgi:hypothetical protein